MFISFLKCWKPFKAAGAATCAFFWLDMVVYWIEAVLMSGIHNMIKVSEEGNIQVGGKGASGSGTSAGAKSWMAKNFKL